MAIATKKTTPTKTVKKPALVKTATRKTTVKPATKAAVKKTVKPLAQAFAQAQTDKKPAKVKKPKLVRDSFTIPKPEYVVLDELKQRGARLARPVKKSELIRAGIKALAAMTDSAFLAAVSAVPAIKTGRPLAQDSK
jgi:hypothetical protein